MLRPLGSLDAARRVLDRLRSEAKIGPPELLRIAAWTRDRLQNVSCRRAALEAALEPPTQTDVAIDLGTWAVAVFSFLAAVADWLVEDRLSRFGWAGLGLGVLGLFGCAAVTQRARSRRADLEVEVERLEEWRILLTDVSDELERRVAADR